jgi:uncharacterized membrane protein
MLLAAVAVNLGLLPANTPAALPGLQALTVKLATPLLLFSANLREVLRGAKSLLPAFALGACGTLAGVFVADCLLHSQLVTMGVAAGDARGGLNLAAALAAKNIGGGLNYVAVTTTLEVPRALFIAGIAIDNIAALVYFPLVSFLGTVPWLSSRRRSDTETKADIQRSDETDTYLHGGKNVNKQPLDDASAETVLLTLTVALLVVAFSEQFGTKAAMPVATALTVLLATGFPELMARLSPCASLLGKVLLYVFFASAGAAAGSMASVFRYGALFAFLAIVYVVHLGFVLLIGRGVLGLHGPELLVASNANIGGPATAASLASAKKWDDLLVPGILLGNFGNAIATFIGIGVGAWIYR